MRLRLQSTIALLVLGAFSLNAQDGPTIRDYGFATFLNPAATSSNPALIDRLDVGRIAMASLSAAKDNGELRSLETSPDSFEAGAQTESYIKISDRIAFYGKLSYSYFKGKDMGGQVFMNPDYNPVNFLEATDTTIGVKIRELYHLVGGMSYRFNDRWSAGIKADYEAGNMAKRRDPRFKNIWMDLDLAASVAFTPSKTWTFGASLLYECTIETIKGHIYGAGDRQYSVYTDKGGFYGISEMLAGSYPNVPDDSDRPMTNNFAGLRLEAIHEGSVYFSNAVTGRYRYGSYGLGSYNSPTIFEFSGIEASYDGRLMVASEKNIHNVELSATYALLDNSENSYKYETPTGGNTKVVYYGQNEILNRSDIDASLSYSFLQDVTGYLPAAEYKAGATMTSRAQTTTLYPYYRDSGRTRIDAFVSACWNIESGKNILSPCVGACFTTGFGTAKEDGTLASSASTNLKSFDSYLNRQFEYETASRAGASISFKYTRLISNALAVYAGVSDSFVSLLSEPEYMYGRFRNAAVLTVGCNF